MSKSFREWKPRPRPNYKYPRVTNIMASKHCNHDATNTYERASGPSEYFKVIKADPDEHGLLECGCEFWITAGVLTLNRCQEYEQHKP